MWRWPRRAERRRSSRGCDVVGKAIEQAGPVGSARFRHGPKRCQTLVAVNRSVTVIDRFIEACRPYRFRGKMRLLNRLVPCDGEKSATVFGHNMTLELAAPYSVISTLEITSGRKRVASLHFKAGNDRPGRRRQCRLLHRTRRADRRRTWTDIRHRAISAQFSPPQRSDSQ